MTDFSRNIKRIIYQSKLFVTINCDECLKLAGGIMGEEGKGYEPSEEDIRLAEDHMENWEKDASKNREHYLKNFAEGVTGDYKPRADEIIDVRDRAREIDHWGIENLTDKIIHAKGLNEAPDVPVKVGYWRSEDKSKSSSRLFKIGAELPEGEEGLAKMVKWLGRAVEAEANWEDDRGNKHKARISESCVEEGNPNHMAFITKTERIGEYKRTMRASTAVKEAVYAVDIINFRGSKLARTTEIFNDSNTWIDQSQSRPAVVVTHDLQPAHGDYYRVRLNGIDNGVLKYTVLRKQGREEEVKEYKFPETDPKEKDISG